MPDSPLSGTGMGLPLCRLYAIYLGGKLELMNMPGVGVDAYLYLNRLNPGEMSEEDYTSLTSLSSTNDDAGTRSFLQALERAL